MKKDIVITVFPQTCRAVIEACSVKGRLFMEQNYNKKFATVEGDQINTLITALREQHLSFSYKAEAKKSI